MSRKLSYDSDSCVYDVYDLTSQKMRTREKEREMNRQRDLSTGYKQFIHQWFIQKGILVRSIQRASRKQEDISARCHPSSELFWVKRFRERVCVFYDDIAAISRFLSSRLKRSSKDYLTTHMMNSYNIPII